MDISFVYPFKRDSEHGMAFHFLTLDYIGPGEKSCYNYHQILIAFLGFGICIEWDGQ